MEIYIPIKRIFCTFIAISALIPVWCIAKPTVIQKEFLAIEKKIQQKNKFRKTNPKKLKKYSLYPYLEFALIRNQLQDNPVKKIETFYKKYKTQPVTKKLNYYWIKYLGKNQQWQEIIDYYRENNSVALQCLHVTAKQHVTPDAITIEEISKLWLNGKSRPKECDSLFKIWLEKKTITNELIWERIYLAMEHGNSSLIKYLGKYLSNDDNQDIKLWLRVHNNSTIVNKAKTFNKENPFHHRIIIHGLQKEANKNIDKSLRYFRELNLIFKFKNKDKYQYYKHLAVLMYVRDHEMTENILNDIPVKYYDEKLYGIAIKNALKINDWNLVIRRIKKLPLEIRKQDIWVYWQARSFEEINKPNIARSLYLSIANKTNYYGLMACNNLNQFCPIEFTITQPFQSDKAKLLRKAGIKRAIEFYSLNRSNDARLEWNHVVKTLNEKQKFIAANIADDLNWYDRSIVTVALHDKDQANKKPSDKKENINQEVKTDSSGQISTLKSNNMMHLKYPLGYESLILKLAKKYKLDPAWIFAISRQESSFIKDAKSSAGAIGIMQLMPATAKEVAKDYKIPYRNKWNLLKERTNINLGAAYLQQMLENHNGNPVLATAAYNAGPHRVKQWTENIKSLSTDIWIELVPFKETRNYLKRVVTNTVIYRSRLGKPATMLNDIFPHSIENLD